MRILRAPLIVILHYFEGVVVADCGLVLVLAQVEHKGQVLVLGVLVFQNVAHVCRIPRKIEINVAEVAQGVSIFVLARQLLPRVEVAEAIRAGYRFEPPRLSQLLLMLVLID